MVLKYMLKGGLHYYLNICEKCNCICNTKHFQQEFNYWTSGNNDINKFIQDTQLSAHSNYNLLKTLEWIPYNKFYNIKYITKDEFSKVYRANWIDGYIVSWDMIIKIGKEIIKMRL